MSSRRILLVQGHPDAGARHLGHALADAYAEAASSARVVVTMGMPAVLYRWCFRAHSVNSLERNILGFVGISPVKATLIGGVDSLGSAGAQRWLSKLHRLGRDAA